MDFVEKANSPYLYKHIRQKCRDIPCNVSTRIIDDWQHYRFSTPKIKYFCKCGENLRQYR
ncbi:MAG: hypothetical protein HCA26_03425 [Dolichospermum sp. DET66]|nr:hypothetical protein [Dolichospermum sp. DET66]